jgi:thiol-disulfide isomerase/thioredoxin
MQKLFKNKFLSWIVIFSVIFTIYLTGLQTEVIGQMQQLILTTGIIRPDLQAHVSDQTPAKHDFPLLTLDGKTANVSDFKGKVIFINLWATWCPPCIAEMPNIHKLYQKVSAENIAFVMVSMDEDIEKAKKFIKRKEYTFPVYTLKSGLPETFETNIIPTTFVINPSGKIVMRKEGMAKYDTEEFREFLTTMLKK